MMNAFLRIHKNFGLNVCAIFFSLFLSYVGNAQVGIGTTTPLSTFEVNGSTGQTVTLLTADQTLNASHSIVICDKDSQNITLPDATGCKGRMYTIKRGSANTSDVTIKPTSSQKIDDQTMYMLMSAKESVTIVSDGTNWKAIVSSVTVPMMDQIPMGEIGYFSVTGFSVTAATMTTDGNDPKHMYPCNPPTTLSPVSHGFSDGDSTIGENVGKLKYTGTTTKSFHIACTISISPLGSNGIFIFELRKNGNELLPNSRLLQKFSSSNDIQSTALHAYITLKPGEYLELCVGQNAGTNSTMSVKTINLFAMGM